ncbi:toxin [Patescibacteria group bacterium]|nr:toxin [Patescibacteria group bacterium]
MKYRIDYSEEKNLILKETRGVDFEDVVDSLEKGKILDNINHFNKKKYPNQKIFIVEIKKYAYAIPYVIDKKRKVIFLKTVYPNRVLKEKYLKRK